MSPLQGNWNYPTSLRFGAGRVAELPAAARELGIQRALLVTDTQLASLPVADRVREAARAGGLELEVYTGVRPNPLGDDVNGGVEHFRNTGCDGVVALGGGSALDVGKAVALMVGQRRPLWDFEDAGDNWTRVDPRGMVPCVAIPTTSGTGSEVGRASVLIHPEQKRKVIIFHPDILPGRVICDPALTLSLPPRLSAWVGMDALSHNLEAWFATGFHPLAEGIAQRGVALVHASLLRAVEQGEDLQARSLMMAASLMGATAFQRGLGAMHAASHPIGAALDSHHGLTNAVLMPHVLRANAQEIAQPAARLARSLGLPRADLGGLIDWVLRLQERLDIPSSLRALGLREEHVEELVPKVVADPSAATNPVPVDADYARTLLLRALQG